LSLKATLIIQQCPQCTLPDTVKQPAPPPGQFFASGFWGTLSDSTTVAQKGDMNEFPAGTTIGGYQIREEIGRGGMATVYLAHQLSMDRDVALKMLPPQLLNQPVSLERFKQEASIVARLEHRAIVPVHDYGEYQGMPYIVMRYLDAGSVDSLLADGPLASARTLAILEQIAPALDYAHRQGVLHRDLKPSNILLDTNGDAYITDFGIARILGSNTKPLTTSGVVGTPSYMSPEQAQGHDLDGRSDLYSLGVVLFEMLTGYRPFEGDTPYSVAVKHVTEAAPAASGFNPHLPQAVDRVLAKALAKKPDDRYQTAHDLATTLKTALETPDEMPETEPSLNQALQAGEARRNQEGGPALSQPAPLPRHQRDESLPSPHLQLMPAYRSSRSRAYHPPRHRRPWLTWGTVVLLISGLLLAVGLLGAYYLMATDNSDGEGPVPNDPFSQTAIVKLTQTKAARPTIPPTNTARPAEPTSGPTPAYAEPVASPTPTPTPGDGASVTSPY
jgi:serine/threonine protein kinase